MRPVRIGDNFHKESRKSFYLMATCTRSCINAQETQAERHLNGRMRTEHGVFIGGPANHSHSPDCGRSVSLKTVTQTSEKSRGNGVDLDHQSHLQATSATVCCVGYCNERQLGGDGGERCVPFRQKVRPNVLSLKHYG